MVFSYENMVLRPAVLLALGAEPDVIVHVAPVERLTAAGARKRSVAELGKGTPDLLVSVCWRRGDVHGAQWVCFELKAPPCPGTAMELLVCPRCCALGSQRCPCPSARKLAPRWTRGAVSKEQEATHAAWRRGGRWVWVVRTPQEARDYLVAARVMLRAAGLEPCAVEGRS